MVASDSVSLFNSFNMFCFVSFFPSFLHSCHRVIFLFFSVLFFKSFLSELYFCFVLEVTFTFFSFYLLFHLCIFVTWAAKVSGEGRGLGQGLVILFVGLKYEPNTGTPRIYRQARLNF